MLQRGDEVNVRVVQIIDIHKVSVVLKGNEKGEGAPRPHLCGEIVDWSILC